ncbi:hypothetical protein [Paenibacillus sp. LjRoot56]|uniref:hypothetical protein n=1 Tax=Paenibacillus sp. LjRoot56 TaxID=3342333 RepID=UPI003ECF8AD7
MLNSIICVLTIGYGIKQFLNSRNQTNNHDAIAMLLLSAVIVGYCIPIGHYTLPTVESLYTKLYKPVSDYMLEQLKVS